MNISDNNNKLFEIVETLPTKSVNGGSVTIHLCKEVVTSGPVNWYVIAEQCRANGVNTKRSLEFSSEAEARSKYESSK